ncbi:MAG: glycosyltransferase family 2 protein, partial [Anaerolineae bacterium]|nr:glycosyltransferase family 2 protein [Anaerolineae bacterium]
RSVLSVLNQTMHNLEFIVVDDHSTDRTPQILNQIARNDQRLRVIRNPKRMERSWSRNHVILEAVNTPYVAIVDSDDVCMPDRVEQQFAYMQAHPQCVAVGGQYNFITPEGSTYRGGALPTTDEAIRTSLRRRNPLWTCLAMVNKAAFAAVGGYDLTMIFSEDYDFIWRVSNCGSLANLADVILLYNLNWDKERRVYYRRRLNHLRIRMKWLLRTGVQASDLPAALIYLGSSVVPPQVGQLYQKRRYSQSTSNDFMKSAQDWLRTLAEQESSLRAALARDEEKG